MYAFCDCMSDFRLAWTHLDSDQKDRVRRGEKTDLIPTVGHPDELDGQGYDLAASKIDFDFDRVEGVFGYRLLNCGCLDLVMEFGLQYVRIETKVKDKYIEFERVTDEAGKTTLGEGIDRLDVYSARSCFWGIGPQIGFDLNYCLCGDFSFVATANWALLVGENETKSFLVENLQRERPDLDVDVKNACLYRIVPATHMRAGLNYGFDCGCWDFNIEGGYQFYSYVRALDTIEFIDNNMEGRSLDIYSDAGMHGPYVSLIFNF